MPFLQTSLIIAGLLIAPMLQAETIGILIQSSPLAGSQYYAVEKLRALIKPGDRLTLSRETGNRHDRNAVRIDWNGQKLGYVPRAQNRVIARALDTGEKLEARVTKLRNDPDPWKQIEFEVYLIL